MKALLDLFKQVEESDYFDAIRIGLASPDKLDVFSFLSNHPHGELYAVPLPAGAGKAGSLRI